MIKRTEDEIGHSYTEFPHFFAYQISKEETFVLDSLFYNCFSEVEIGVVIDGPFKGHFVYGKNIPPQIKIRRDSGEIVRYNRQHISKDEYVFDYILSGDCEWHYHGEGT